MYNLKQTAMKNQETKSPEKTLSNLYDLAYRAYTGTSFSPEKRAQSVVDSHSEELDNDIKVMQEKGCDQEFIDKYKASYIDHLKKWLGAKSNCISSMIAGPSNFPVRRAEKANRSEEASGKEFIEFREKVFKSIERYNKKKEIAEAGGELEVAKQKLVDLIALQERMKLINKAYPSFVKNGLPGLEKFNLSDADVKIIVQWVPRYSFERLPFQGFSLTNNNAKIKNTEARVKELEKKEEAKSNDSSENETKFNGGVIILDYTLDRILIRHDSVPSEAIRSELKSHGFKWSPFNKCWMRKITENAKYVTFKLLLPKISV